MSPIQPIVAGCPERVNSHRSGATGLMLGKRLQTLLGLAGAAAILSVAPGSRRTARIAGIRASCPSGASKSLPRLISITRTPSLELLAWEEDGFRGAGS